MANPIQNLWPEARVVASTVAFYALEDVGAYFELVQDGTPDATLVSPNGYVSVDPASPTAQFRVFAVGTSPLTIAPVGA
jgi:hypothetical protein